VHCAAQGSTRSSLRLTAQQQLVIIEYLRLQESDSVTVKQIEAARNFGSAVNFNRTRTTLSTIDGRVCNSSLFCWRRAIRFASGGVAQGEARVNAATAAATEFVTFAETLTG
jgi:hypothetical protein